MNPDTWSLKDKRKIFKSLKSWGCDAECGLYEFDIERKKLILSDYQERYADNKCKSLGEYDINLINEGYYYISGKEIEILRKLLIEDIRLNAEGCTQVEEFESIINKRFGVE